MAEPGAWQRQVNHALTNRGTRSRLPDLWVYTISGGQLEQAISKFPESAPRLHRIARLWTIRRALVRYAEYAMGDRPRDHRLLRCCPRPVREPCPSCSVCVRYIHGCPSRRECFERGVSFRGRLYPIYAKELAPHIKYRHVT